MPTQKQTPKRQSNDFVEIDDEIPFQDYPDNWMTVNAFKGEMDRCKTVDDISQILNGQKGNPRLNELIPLASARKQEIIATIG